VSDARRHAKQPGQADQSRGEDRDIAAGDCDDVVGAGALQPVLQVWRQPRAIADQDGGGDGGGYRIARSDV
jgi:hypothetical protein